MKRQIIFSKISKEKLELTLKYLEVEWSISTKKKFIKKLDKCFKQIDSFPDSNKFSKSLRLYKCKLTKQTSFYYRYTEKHIYVSYFIDSRMNNTLED